MNELMRCRRGTTEEGSTLPILPPGYQQVEWIKKTDSSTHISTIKYQCEITGTTKLVLQYEQNGIPSSGNDFFLVKEGDHNGTLLCELYFAASGSLIGYAPNGVSTYFRSGQDFANTSISAVVSFNSTTPTKSMTATSDGIPVPTVDGSGANPTGTATYFMLFGITDIDVKLKRLSFYPNNSLFFDFIPCCRNTDGVIGLYDLVHAEFFAPTGGEFSTGENV